MSLPVKIVMIEDDEGHARLIERNILKRDLREAKIREKVTEARMWLAVYRVKE